MLRCCSALVARAVCAGAGQGRCAFDGLSRADAFAGFAKLLIYFAAAVAALIVAPRLFERDSERCAPNIRC